MNRIQGRVITQAYEANNGKGVAGALLVTHGREGIAFHVLQEHTKRQTEPKSARSVLSASS